MAGHVHGQSEACCRVVDQLRLQVFLRGERDGVKREGPPAPGLLDEVEDGLQLSALPATRDAMPLVLAAMRLVALSMANGPSSSTPQICPRSAILHSDAASIVEGILIVTVSTARRMATLGIHRPRLIAKSIAFWQEAADSTDLGPTAVNPSREADPLAASKSRTGSSSNWRPMRQRGAGAVEGPQRSASSSLVCCLALAQLGKKLNQSGQPVA